MKKFLGSIIIFLFALVPANLAVAAGGTINELSITESNPGVINITGSATGASNIKIIISKGQEAVLDITTPLDEATSTFTAIVDMSATAADYNISVADADGGEAKTATISIGDSEHIATPESNVSSEAVTSTAENDNNFWAKNLPLIIVIVIVAIVIISAAIYFFTIRSRRSRRRQNK